jgi:hypothetical protein
MSSKKIKLWVKKQAFVVRLGRLINFLSKKKQAFGASQRSAHNMKNIHHCCGLYFHEIICALF